MCCVWVKTYPCDKAALSKGVFQRKPATTSGFFVVLELWFCSNVRVNRSISCCCGNHCFAFVLWHCSANAEAMGSNPVEVPKRVFGVSFEIPEIAITTASIISSFKSGVGIVQCRGGSRIFLRRGCTTTEWLN